MSDNNNTPQKAKYSKRTKVISFLIAFGVFWLIFVFAIYTFGLKAIEKNDEAATIQTFFLGLAAALIGAVIAFVVSLRKIGADDALTYELEREKRERAAAAPDPTTTSDAKLESEINIYRECEFCHGELEVHDIKGYNHQSSYSNGYNLNMTGSNTGTITENRVNYSIQTGTVSYRCPHCHYYIKADYEMFNGLSYMTTYTNKAIYGRDDEMNPPRATVERGKLYTSFVISKKRVPF